MPTRVIRLFLPGVVVVLSGCKPTSPGAEALERQKGLTTAVTVEHFQIRDSVPHAWDPKLFADSLVARLKLVEGLSARRSGDTSVASPTDFSVEGDVSLQNGRFVMTARLRHATDAAPVWSATFWRSEDAIPALADEVARGAAEALYNEIVRHSLSNRKRR